jgi:hypothetical protein
LATATLLMVVRVPDTPEVTMMPWTVSLSLVAAAAGTAVATQMARVIPAATSARFTGDLMAPPLFGPELRLHWVSTRCPPSAQCRSRRREFASAGGQRDWPVAAAWRRPRPGCRPPSNGKD